MISTALVILTVILFAVPALIEFTGARLGSSPDYRDALMQGTLMAAITATFAVIVLWQEEPAGGPEDTGHKVTTIEKISDTYDVTVFNFHRPLDRPGDWRLDDDWYRCYVPNPDADKPVLKCASDVVFDDASKVVGSAPAETVHVDGMQDVTSR